MQTEYQKLQFPEEISSFSLQTQAQLVDCFNAYEIPQFYQTLFVKYVSKMPKYQAEYSMKEEIKNIINSSSHIQEFLNHNREKVRIQNFFKSNLKDQTQPHKVKMDILRMCQLLKKLRKANFKIAQALAHIKEKYAQKPENNNVQKIYSHMAVKLDSFRGQVKKSDLATYFQFLPEYDPFYIHLKFRKGHQNERCNEALKDLVQFSVDQSYSLLKMKKILMSWICQEHQQKYFNKASRRVNTTKLPDIRSHRPQRYKIDSEIVSNTSGLTEAQPEFLYKREVKASQSDRRSFFKGNKQDLRKTKYNKSGFKHAEKEAIWKFDKAQQTEDEQVKFSFRKQNIQSHDIHRHAHSLSLVGKIIKTRPNQFSSVDKRNHISIFPGPSNSPYIQYEKRDRIRTDISENVLKFQQRRLNKIKSDISSQQSSPQPRMYTTPLKPIGKDIPKLQTKHLINIEILPIQVAPRIKKNIPSSAQRSEKVESNSLSFQTPVRKSDNENILTSSQKKYKEYRSSSPIDKSPFEQRLSYKPKTEQTLKEQLVPKKQLLKLTSHKESSVKSIVNIANIPEEDGQDINKQEPLKHKSQEKHPQINFQGKKRQHEVEQSNPKTQIVHEKFKPKQQTILTQSIKPLPKKETAKEVKVENDVIKKEQKMQQSSSHKPEITQNKSNKLSASQDNKVNLVNSSLNKDKNTQVKLKVQQPEISQEKTIQIKKSQEKVNEVEEQKPQQSQQRVADKKQQQNSGTGRNILPERSDDRQVQHQTFQNKQKEHITIERPQTNQVKKVQHHYQQAKEGQLETHQFQDKKIEPSQQNPNSLESKPQNHPPVVQPIAGDNKSAQITADQVDQKVLKPVIEESKKEVKLKVGKFTFQTFEDYLKAYQINPSYVNGLQLQKIIKQTKVQQSYVTQFFIDNLPATLAISSVTPNNNFIIRLWLVSKYCQDSMSNVLFKKYVDHIEKSITNQNIYYRGKELSEVLDAGFALKTSHAYLRQRKSQARVIESQYEPFVSMECSQIVFVQKQKEDMLYSDQIQNFTFSNSLAADFLFEMEEQEIPDKLKEIVKVRNELPSLSALNKELSKTNIDNYAITPQMNAQDIDLSYVKFLSQFKDMFVACDGFFKFYGNVVTMHDNKAICSIKLTKHNARVCFARGYKSLDQVTKNLKVQSQTKIQFLIPMFNKKLYGKYKRVQSEEQTFYCNWDFTFYWQDEMQGLVRHNMKHGLNFGQSTFYVTLQVEGQLLYVFDVNKDDHLF